MIKITKSKFSLWSALDGSVEAGYPRVHKGTKASIGTMMHEHTGNFQI